MSCYDIGTMKDLIVQILQSNPGVVTLLISGFLLPVVILMLTNRQGKKIKQLESEIDLAKLKATKEIEKDLSASEKRRTHEDTVLASLYKILFEVQRLHIELSANCVDYQCIDKALGKFQAAFEKYHGIISDNQIHLSSKVTGNLYRFYQSLAALLIELQDIKAANKPEIALVSVFEHSQKLSEQIVDIHELFVTSRTNLAKEFKKDDLRPVFQCCSSGTPLSPEAQEALIKELASLRAQKEAKKKTALSGSRIVESRPAAIENVKKS
jgi:hypothetical protein